MSNRNNNKLKDYYTERRKSPFCSCMKLGFTFDYNADQASWCLRLSSETLTAIHVLMLGIRLISWLNYIYLFIWGGAHIPQAACGSQRTTLSGQFSAFSLVPRTKFITSDLMARTLTYWANPWLFPLQPPKWAKMFCINQLPPLWGKHLRNSTSRRSSSFQRVPCVATRLHCSWGWMKKTTDR